MNSELEAIKTAWDKRPAAGLKSSTSQGPKHAEGDDKVRKLADDYVAKHKAEFAGLKDKTLDECVKAVGVFRDAGMEDEQWRVEVWLLHKFEPQNIGGPVQAKVRFPSNG